MLYTRKGDLGDTGLYGCDQRISKSSAVAEALGVLDETNSFLGLCKVRAEKDERKSEAFSFVFASEASQSGNLSNIIHDIQENLFIIQSQIAGSDKNISEEKIIDMEKLIGEIEKELPPIKTFFISGGTELSARLDFARTLSRRAERRVVAVHEENLVDVQNTTLKYLNRLSSLLYALTRITNQQEGVMEQSPRY